MTARRPTARTEARPPAVPVETKVPFSFVHINKCGGSSVEIALGIGKRHATAAAMRDEIGAEAWARRFTFSIVRNPFERVVSIYYYRVRTDQGGLADRHLNINQWVEKVWDAEDPRYCDTPLLLTPAADWLCADGHLGDDLIVDDVAKLERLGEDWARIAGRLGVPATLPMTNANAHPRYEQVLDARARGILERAFARDLDLFGYRF